MVKKHLKRHATPRTWRIKRKGTVFITRPNPGAHAFSMGMSVNLLLKMMGYAKTSNEVKRLLQFKELLVDGKRVKDPKRLAGLMDVVSLPGIGKAYRIVIGKDGKLSSLEIDQKESLIKPCKIIGKTLLKGGKMQLNLFDGKNIAVEKGEYRVGDTVIVEFAKNTVKELIKLEKGAYILLTAGKHIADTGIVEDIQGNKVIYKSENKVQTTLKKYAFAVGREKPVVSIEIK